MQDKKSIFQQQGKSEMVLMKKSSSLLRQAGRILLAGMCLWGATQASAANGYAMGQVEYVRTHDGTALPAWAPPRFWFTVKGVTQAGNCPKLADSRVLFVGNDSKMFTMIMSAQASGQQISVAYDDTSMSAGWCNATYITIGTPAIGY